MANKLKPLRKCVIGAIVNKAGNILVGERSDQSQSIWQLPQGGVEDHEDIRTALLRELTEEVGHLPYIIVKELEEPIDYEFPSNATFKIAKKYRGQSQYWFLLHLDHDNDLSILKPTEEFRRFCWANPTKIVEEIISWKKESYHRGLTALGII